MSGWRPQRVPFHYQLSDLTLFSVRRRMQVKSVGLPDMQKLPAWPRPSPAELLPNSQGFLWRGFPVTDEHPAINRQDGYIQYVTAEYERCYVDLSQSFERYSVKFSSKTKSTIKRKIKKFSEKCAGKDKLVEYHRPGDIRGFFASASVVSKRSYQARLLGAGLPDSEDFVVGTEALAEQGRVRAFVLYDGERPVSYLFCPIKDGIVEYGYLGYDPEYMGCSVGAVLHWLALERLFDAGWHYLDFGEGVSEHKLFYSTGKQMCVDVCFLKGTLTNMLIVRTHFWFRQVSRYSGRLTNRLGLKSKIKHFIRFST